MSPCLFYADDTLFFVKLEIQQIQVLKIVPVAFGCISGLKVSYTTSRGSGTEAGDNYGQQQRFFSNNQSGITPYKQMIALNSLLFLDLQN